MHTYMYTLTYNCFTEFVGFTIDSPPAVDFSTAIPGTDGGRVTLSETAVKPMYPDLSSVPKCDISEVDMSSLIARVRHHVLTNRLRVCTIFF